MQIATDLVRHTLVALRRALSPAAFLPFVFLCLAFAVVLTGLLVDPRFYWAGLALAPLAIVTVRAHLSGVAQRRIAELRRQWGRGHTRDRDFAAIESLFRYSASSEADAETTLDDQTWADLDMDELYATIDRTLTTPGACVLYKMLRTPLLHDGQLINRNCLVQLFQRDRAYREELQLNLLRLGRQRADGLTSLVWGRTPPSTPARWLFSFLALAALVCLIAGPLALGSKAVIIIILPVYVLNFVVTCRVRPRLLFHLETIRYLGAMIRLGRRISVIGRPEMQDRAQTLAKASAAVHRIARKTLLLFPEYSASADLGAVLYAHFDIYFLREVRIYYALLEQIRVHQDELRTIYSVIGELDALQSIASYRQGLRQYVEPDLQNRDVWIQAADLCHPLLANAVPNSITIREKGVMITGSNMAGKTTFLRALGVNVVLSQTIYTCVASSYAGRHFRVISSINEQDALLEGKSYYLVEAERLLKMIGYCDSEVPVLCLIDEPLAGTNSTERFRASLEILRYLSTHGALVAVATHDLELARRLESHLRVYHFTDDVGQHGLRFSFRLREGLAVTSNAIRLLEHLGYPQSIIERAMREGP